MKEKISLSIIIILAFILTACNMPTEEITESGFNKNGILTAAAQTVEAIMTDESIWTIEETPAPTFSIPIQQVTETPNPNAQLTPTNTPPEATETDDSCNLASFVADVTVPDGADYKSGDVFIKTWRLKNNGSCTWTSDYELVFFDGYSMGGAASQQLTNSDIAPGEELEISIELTAPISNGRYKGFWKLRSPDGLIFSLNGNVAFWVEIDVVP